MNFHQTVKRRWWYQAIIISHFLLIPIVCFEGLTYKVDSDLYYMSFLL